jgi:hypothetical protein
MTLKPAVPLACLLAALVTTGTARVHALDCALPEVVAPSPDSVHVPTNTLVWCTKDPLRPSAPIVLRDSLGESVSGTQTQMTLPSLELLVYRPDAELAPDSQYTVECPIRWEGQQPLSHVFTTGPGSRATPPAVPSVANVNLVADDGVGWGPSYFANFLQAVEPRTIVVVDLGRSATLNANAPSGFVSDADFNFYNEDVFVGRNPCGGNWDGANLGASTTVALGAFDLTGAFSGWSDTVTVTIPSELNGPDREADVAEQTASEPPDVDPDGADDREGDDEPGAGDDADGYAVITPTATDDRVAPSATGRSGCDLGARSASPWGAVSLLTLAWLGARRRRGSAERAAPPR